MRKLIDSWRLFLAIYRMMDSGIWIIANKAVKAVREDRQLNLVALTEDRLVFCTRCGQIPDGDRRMDEAREKVMNLLNGESHTRSQIDAALALNYLLVKR